MITTFSGAIIRTTHMTGIMTDLGIMIGAKLRGESFDFRKAKLFLFIFGGFLSGGIIGANLYASLSIGALIVPILLALTLAVTYWLFIANRHINH